MCSKVVILLGLSLVAQYASGFTIREKSKKEDLTTSLRTLARYQQRLQSQGLIPKPDHSEPHDQPTDLRNFDELELLQLIPVTIKQLRHGQLKPNERVSLRNVFGEIWSLMVEESRRKRYEPRDEVLSILLNSREVRFGKQEIRQQLESDVAGNSIQKVFNTDDSMPIHLSDDLTVEPSQRLLRMVAAIIQKAYKEGAGQPRPTGGAVLKRNRPKRSINLENVKVTIHMPRTRRSLQPSIALKSTAGLSSDEKRRVEEANEAAIMEAVLAQIGDNDFEEYDDDDDEEEYYEEDEESSSNKEPESANSVNNEDDEDDDEEEQAGAFGQMPDYAYDDVGNSDDYFLDEYQPRFSAGDFENPSVNELIMLAARHSKNGKPSGGMKNFLPVSDEQDYEY